MQHSADFFITHFFFFLSYPKQRENLLCCFTQCFLCIIQYQFQLTWNGLTLNIFVILINCKSFLLRQLLPSFFSANFIRTELQSHILKTAKSCNYVAKCLIFIHSRDWSTALINEPRPTECIFIWNFRF